MNCKLCDKEIVNYNPMFNQLKLDESKTVHLCQDCVDKLGKWQGSIIANLFPTKALKNKLRKTEEN